MGVDYFAYCRRHRELLYLGKWWHLARLGKLSPDAVERTRKQVARDLPRRGPNEIRRDDRIIELLAAFLSRHKGCETRGGSDLGKEFERKIAPQLDDWQGFDVGGDVRLIEYEKRADAEKERNYIEKYQPEVVLLEKKLDGGQISKRRRESAQRWIEDMKSRLHRAQNRLGEIERELAGGDETADRTSPTFNPTRSGLENNPRQVDLVEQMKTTPLPR
jgi:hypothetical protein